MTNIEILRTYNDWRRDRTGNRTLEDFGITPRMIGEALDAVIKDAERMEWLESAWGGYTGRDGGFHLSVYMPSDAETLREMIDAAMKVGQQ